MDNENKTNVSNNEVNDDNIETKIDELIQSNNVIRALLIKVLRKIDRVYDEAY